MGCHDARVHYIYGRALSCAVGIICSVPAFHAQHPLPPADMLLTGCQVLAIHTFVCCIDLGRQLVDMSADNAQITGHACCHWM